MFKYLELGSVLAKGGSGTIQEAFHTITGIPLVLKKSRKDQYSVREATILPSLNHPNIVRCLYTQVTDTHVTLVLERALEGDFQVYLKKVNKLNEDDARKVFVQLVEAVSYLHNKNIVHRDIKLENLLLHEGKVILADFEFSLNFQPGVRENRHYVGTLEYTSPEVRYEKYVGPEIDIWAMGVVLYKLVTGKFPFQTDDLKKIQEKLFLPEYLSLWCRGLISSMLHPHVSERMTIEDLKKYPWITKQIDPNDKPLSLTSNPLLTKQPIV